MASCFAARTFLRVDAEETAVVAQAGHVATYEEDVDLILAGLKDVSEGLAETGKLGAGVRELLRFVGSGMSTHNQVVCTLALLDTPALAWEDETLDRIYQGLRAQLEIADRYRATVDMLEPVTVRCSTVS